MDKQEKRRRVMELWKSCFHDSDAFVDFYFSEKYADENVVSVWENDRLLSALQMIPYTSTCWGAVFPVSYIAGASTAPDVRGRGLMSGLLRQSFRVMFGRGVAFTILIPAEPGLFDYYARFGYAPVYYGREVSFDISVEKYAEPKEKPLSRSSMYEYFFRRQLSSSCSVLHDRKDFEAIVKDFESDGGAVVSVSSRDRIIALAFAQYDGTRVFIPEWVYDDDISKNALLAKCANRFRCRDIFCRIPSGPDGKAYGMARIIRVEDMLKSWASLFPECSCQLSVVDEVIPENNGLFVVEKGVCYKNSLDAGTEAMDIGRLTALLLLGEDKNGRCPFPRQQPSMSLMFS